MRRSSSEDRYVAHRKSAGPRHAYRHWVAASPTVEARRHFARLRPRWHLSCCHDVNNMTKSLHGLTSPRAALAAAMLFTFACSSGQPGQRGVPDGGGGASGGAGGGEIGGGGEGAGAGRAGGGSVGGGGVSAGGTGGSRVGGGGHGGTSVAGAGGRATGGIGGTGGTPVSGSPCHANNDCGNIGILECRAPGEFLGCGACRQGQSACATDTDCAAARDGGAAVAHMICDLAPSTDCYCSSVKTCQPGCRTPSDCSAGQDCNALHRCQNTCTPGPAACPANYVCSGGFCTQNTCTDDSQCSGACVKGRCYGSAGVCEFRPA